MRKYDLTNPVHMVRCIARERYAWPGGYELCGVTSDGALLCSHCVRDNYRNILDSTKKDISDGWKIIGITNESELENDSCSHCNTKLGYWEDEWEDEKVYTEEIHAKRLIEMLEKDDPCDCCPAAPEFYGGSSPSLLWDIEREHPCAVCKNFLSIMYSDFLKCPCHIFGQDKALELTYKKLKEKGYM